MMTNSIAYFVTGYLMGLIVSALLYRMRRW